MKKHIKAIVALILGAIAFAVGFAAFAQSLKADIGRELEAARPSDGIGRVQAADAELYAASAEQAGEGTALRVWCETDEDLPEWWDPESAEIVYEAPIARPIHSDALDYNLNTTLWGWDGHGAEAWELELFARCFYLEFWGASETCCEAGCDAMLNLWASGLYGRTMYDSLSHYDPVYGYTYEVYPWVWETVYDADGLAWCKEFCETRFVNGPTWGAMYFQLGCYHDQSWVSPLYELDGVYFSGPSGK